MEKVRYLASCPICGARLFKGIPGSVNEVFCPKCKNKLEIQFGSNGIAVHVLSETDIHLGANSAKETQSNIVC